MTFFIAISVWLIGSVLMAWYAGKRGSYRVIKDLSFRHDWFIMTFYITWPVWVPLIAVAWTVLILGDLARYFYRLLKT